MQLPNPLTPSEIVTDKTLRHRVHLLIKFQSGEESFLLNSICFRGLSWALTNGRDPVKEVIHVVELADGFNTVSYGVKYMTTVMEAWGYPSFYNDEVKVGEYNRAYGYKVPLDLPGPIILMGLQVARIAQENRDIAYTTLRLIELGVPATVASILGCNMRFDPSRKARFPYLATGHMPWPFFHVSNISSGDHLVRVPFHPEWESNFFKRQKTLKPYRSPAPLSGVNQLFLGDDARYPLLPFFKNWEKELSGKDEHSVAEAIKDGITKTFSDRCRYELRKPPVRHGKGSGLTTSDGWGIVADKTI